MTDILDVLGPDYVGAWYEGPFKKSIIRGKFYMYIQERKPIVLDENRDENNVPNATTHHIDSQNYIDNNKHIGKNLEHTLKRVNSNHEDIYSINGIIFDELGKARFVGRISSKHIQFKMKYVDSHLNNFHEFEEKFYIGRLMPGNRYGGFYGYKDEELKCVEYFRTLKFILKKPLQPNAELKKNICIN